MSEDFLFVVDSQMLVRLLLMNTIGISVLCEALRNASYFYKVDYGNHFVKRKEVNECYAFVQGTGLEILLESYHLNYDADQIRNGFNYYLKRTSN